MKWNGKNRRRRKRYDEEEINTEKRKKTPKEARTRDETEKQT